MSKKTPNIKVTSSNKPNLANLDLLAKLIFERINKENKIPPPDGLR